MRQIASATDTSLGAIYYHFDGKESILRVHTVSPETSVQGLAATMGTLFLRGFLADGAPATAAGGSPSG